VRKPLLRLYAPFIALALVQAAFIAVAPSRGPAQDVALGSGEHLGPDQPGQPGQPASGAGLDGETAVSTPGEAVGEAGESAQPLDGGAAAGGSGGISGQERPGGAGNANRPVTATGDTSHCTRNGRQHGFFYNAPPCVPKWSGGDNGGATARGVTGDSVTVFFYREKKNEAVAAILTQEGLARSKQQEDEFAQAAEEFLNKHYEFHGRKVDVQVYYGNCPETPPDVPVCKAEAREIAKKNPFLVLWPVPLYPDVFDEFYKLGVPIIGGWHFDERYFTQRRPYRYDVFMDGAQTAEIAAEYYCKKMANKKATHTGRVIHPSIGARDQVDRRVGIISPELPAFLDSAKRLQQRVAACDGQEPVLVTYASDIERAQSQANANISALIDAKVTTVVCMCDPIAPVFRTATATRQGYFPEHLLAGSGLLDYDKLGRLYEPRQWEHAFGPSHLQLYPAFKDTESAVVWRATGRPGLPCEACNLPWSYYSLAGTLIQMAGPNLTPLTLERAALSLPVSGGWQQTGGQADVVMVKFGQGDYTAISDVKEVYWSASAISPLDRKPGAYVPVKGGRRYERGQWDGKLEIPVPAN
jgi:hypothetical protein